MLNASWSNQSLAWVSRILGIALAALNAWGWWNESQSRQDSTGVVHGDWLYQWAVTTHLLPVILIVLGLIFGWKQPFYGALALALFIGLQALSVGTEWAYLPIVVLPPLVITLCFLTGWLLAIKKRN